MHLLKCTKQQIYKNCCKQKGFVPVNIPANFYLIDTSDHMTTPHRSLAAILFSWHLLWRWLLAFLLPYGLFSITSIVAADSVNEAMGALPPYRVGLVHGEALPSDLYAQLEAVGELQLLQTEEEAQIAVEEDSCDLVLMVQQRLESGPYTGTIKVYYNSMRHVRTVRVVQGVLRDYEQNLVADNLAQYELEKNLIDPLVIQQEDLFSPFTVLGEVVEETKGVMSNVLNFLWILLVTWLARQLILRIAIYTPRSFWRNLAAATLGTLLGMVLVFWGVQQGLDTDQSGMIQRVIVILQQLIVVDELWRILLLWVPTWLFVLGVLGSLTMSSTTQIDAYGRTFWMVVVFHVLALFACKGAVAMKGWMLWVPILNVFQLGQLNLKGNLVTSDWTLALVVTSIWAMLFLVLWRWLLARSTTSYEEEAL